ncbi:MAG: M20/M25/M40 family metallo-hydrolase [Desulfosarcina sp.]
MEEIVTLTQDLIRFRTMHREPQEIEKCAAFVEDYLNRHQIAFSHVVHEGYPSILVMPDGHDVEVLFMAHIDVVDAEEPLFDPVIRNGNLYGRGAIDDKYAVALSLVLTKEHTQRLRHQGRTQKELPFGVLITSDEEIGGYHGVGAMVDTIQPKFCIALDGGNPQLIVVKEKGLLTVKMIASGKAAHGSRPWLGENAVDNLIADYAALKTLFERPARETWVKTMNLSIINAGKSFNQVPDRAEAIFDVRYTENEDTDQLFQRMQDKVASQLVVMRKEPMFVGGTSPYLDRILDLAETIEVGFEHGASDARFFSEKGISGIVWGAEGDHSAHAADEHVNIESISRVYDVLDRFMEELATDQRDR